MYFLPIVLLAMTALILMGAAAVVFYLIPSMASRVQGAQKRPQAPEETYEAPEELGHS